MANVKDQKKSAIDNIAEGKEFRVLDVRVPGGVSMPTHHTTSEAIISVHSGVADLTMDGKVHHLEAGSVFVLPSGRAHSLEVKEDFNAHVILKSGAAIEF